MLDPGLDRLGDEAVADQRLRGPGHGRVGQGQVAPEVSAGGGPVHQQVQRDGEGVRRQPHRIRGGGGTGHWSSLRK